MELGLRPERQWWHIERFIPHQWPWGERGRQITPESHAPRGLSIWGKLLLVGACQGLFSHRRTMKGNGSSIDWIVPLFCHVWLKGAATVCTSWWWVSETKFEDFNLMLMLRFFSFMWVLSERRTSKDRKLWKGCLKSLQVINLISKLPCCCDGGLYLTFVIGCGVQQHPEESYSCQVRQGGRPIRQSSTRIRKLVRSSGCCLQN